jgi:trans-aconitate methyltransferase
MKKKNIKVDFDDYAENYNTLLNQQLRFFDKNDHYFAEYKVNRAKEVLTLSPTTILDFGCGVGRTCAYLQKCFPLAQVYGYDVSAQSLGEAKKNAPTVNFLSVLPSDNSLQFDFIFIAGVLHHVSPSQRKALMHSILQRTTAQGTVMVFEHNPFNPMTRYLVSTCAFDHDAILLKPRELKALFTQAGFTQIKTEYTLFFPAFLKGLRKIEPYLKHLPLGGQYMVRGVRESKPYVI